MISSGQKKAFGKDCHAPLCHFTQLAITFKYSLPPPLALVLLPSSYIHDQLCFGEYPLRTKYVNKQAVFQAQQISQDAFHRQVSLGLRGFRGVLESAAMRNLRS